MNPNFEKRCGSTSHHYNWYNIWSRLDIVHLAVGNSHKACQLCTKSSIVITASTLQQVFNELAGPSQSGQHQCNMQWPLGDINCTSWTCSYHMQASSLTQSSNSGVSSWHRDPFWNKKYSRSRQSPRWSSVLGLHTPPVLTKTKFQSKSVGHSKGLYFLSKIGQIWHSVMIRFATLQEKAAHTKGHPS